MDYMGLHMPELASRMHMMFLKCLNANTRRTCLKSIEIQQGRTKKKKWS